MLTVVTGWVLVVLGALLGAGGVWLAFSAEAGLTSVWASGWSSAACCSRAAAASDWLCTRRCWWLRLIWALWEVGFDRWALIPRGAFFAVVGLWLLTPWISRPLSVADTADAPCDPLGGARAAGSAPRWLS